MISLNFSAAHKFVREQKRLGVDIRWDGWSIVIWKATHYGYMNKNGSYRNGRWGIENRVEIADAGVWRIGSKNVRTATRTKS